MATRAMVNRVRNYHDSVKACISKGHVENLRCTIRRFGQDNVYRRRMELTTLAIEHGSLDVLVYLLDIVDNFHRDSALLETLTESACMRGNLDALKHLVEVRGVQVPLLLNLILPHTVENDHFDITRYLIEKGQGRRFDIEQAFVTSASKGSLQFLLFFRDLTVDFDKDCVSRAILCAASTNKLVAIKYIVREWNVNVRELPAAIMIFPAIEDHIQVVRYLVEQDFCITQGLLNLISDRGIGFKVYCYFLYKLPYFPKGCKVRDHRLAPISGQNSDYQNTNTVLVNFLFGKLEPPGFPLLTTHNPYYDGNIGLVVCSFVL